MTVSFQFQVNAGPRDRNECPVGFAMGKDDPRLNGGRLESLSVCDEDGRPVPVQCCEEEGRYIIRLIVDRLAKGSGKTYSAVVHDRAAAESDPSAGGVEVHPNRHKLDISIDGRYFTSYVFDPAVAKPYLGAVAGPHGDSFTRLDFETKEHPHHRSLWLAIGDVNGIDMWNEPEGRHGKQRHLHFSRAAGGPVCATITAHNVWTSFADKPQIDETRTLTVYRTPAAGRIVDVDATFTANYGQVEFGATKEAGPLGIRVTESMKVDNGGTMVNSYGSIGEQECWGQRAEWCDYYGAVGDYTYGIAAFDHPDNENYPTYWHIRNYGLLAPNNFYFAGGKLIKPGEKVNYRYRVYFHEGDSAVIRIISIRPRLRYCNKQVYSSPGSIRFLC
ncbi:PmoA family protein [Paenibacillus piri]|uniref:Uncharacterized protein n=1 Tax=Paenibacillus piri TaxID=2547395 RepID=A0A4V2ZUE1_9BACL|nr:PmoA family protein [Paenibacillus piri]TDG00555.1 hypothetical protein E1757_02680 [Paenibacillus piri]